MLNRKIESIIIEWLNNSKQALLIDGARQVGKTTVIRNVLTKSSTDYVELNLIDNKKANNFFKNIDSISTENFILGLTVLSNKPLKKHKTVIFIDEVQLCPDLITMIKFLVEEGSYSYILSGSILGITLSNLRSAPVGYLQIEQMYPLDFEEFIRSFGIQDETFDYLYKQFVNKEPVLDTIHEKLMDLFTKYLIVGGMPDAVQSFHDNGNYAQVQKILNDIIKLYKADFSKYQNNDKKLKLMAIYDLIPSELNAQNKRYYYKNISQNFRLDRYEGSFEWLYTAETSIPIYNVVEPSVPLRSNQKSNLFKLFLNDVGLLTASYGMDTVLQILSNNNSINYGAIYENYVAQELHAHGFPGYYYNSKKYGVLDFIVENNGRPLPIEVKSGKAYTRHSALDNILSAKNFNIDYAYVLSNENLSYADYATIEKSNRDFEIKDEYRIYYLPIYMTMFLDKAKIKIDDAVYKSYEDVNALASKLL